ncbi:MAG: hypothetical protein K1060chlam5_00824 [Candidatus Anoxychlamydiales bacterium]|nr:hypothetical protein [Candidatus Anoxychlamydiales bacterium]
MSAIKRRGAAGAAGAAGAGAGEFNSRHSTRAVRVDLTARAAMVVARGAGAAGAGGLFNSSHSTRAVRRASMVVAREEISPQSSIGGSAITTPEGSDIEGPIYGKNRDVIVTQNRLGALVRSAIETKVVFKNYQSYEAIEEAVEKETVEKEFKIEKPIIFLQCRLNFVQDDGGETFEYKLLENLKEIPFEYFAKLFIYDNIKIYII